MSSSSHDPSRGKLNATQFATYAARVLADNRFDNVLVLDVRKLSSVADLILIGSGTSDRQIRATADELNRLAAEYDYGKARRDGKDPTEWVVMDYFDVIVHLMTHQQRLFFDLESLWYDAQPVDWSAMTEPGQFAYLSQRKSSA